MKNLSKAFQKLFFKFTCKLVFEKAIFKSVILARRTETVIAGLH